MYIIDWGVARAAPLSAGPADRLLPFSRTVKK